MKLNCNVIHDLLPLYVDQICSDESRELVDEHLIECKDCSKILKQMRNTEIEAGLKSETEDVIQHQAKFFKRKSAIVGTVIAGIFMIPILVCLIVNLATGAALDWFFIVLASLVTAASLIIVPLMMPENKLFWTFVTFTMSLLLLLGVICIYTHGRWFFVASSSTLFGFSVCFLPFTVYARPIKALFGKQKGLAVMTIITILYVLMMLSIGFYTKSAEFGRMAPIISLPFVALAWVFFLLIRYLKCNGLLKAGICTAIFGFFGGFADYFINTWIGNEVSFPVFRPLTWNLDTINGNVDWLILLIGVFVGLILIAAGVIKGGKRK